MVLTFLVFAFGFGEHNFSSPLSYMASMRPASTYSGKVNCGSNSCSCTHACWNVRPLVFLLFPFEHWLSGYLQKIRFWNRIYSRPRAAMVSWNSFSVSEMFTAEHLLPCRSWKTHPGVHWRIFPSSAVKQSLPGVSGFVNSFFHMIFLVRNKILFDHEFTSTLYRGEWYGWVQLLKLITQKLIEIPYILLAEKFIQVSSLFFSWSSNFALTLACMKGGSLVLKSLNFVGWRYVNIIFDSLLVFYAIV